MQPTNMDVYLCTHTQHHVHAEWRQSSLYCKPEGSWQDCGDAASGWGYSRPADQGGKLLFVLLSLVLCHAQYSLYTKHHHNIQGNMNVWKHIQQITAADMHWRIKLFVHWKHVHLVHGLITCFPNKFGLRLLVCDQNSSEFYSYQTCTCVQKCSLIACFGVKQCTSAHIDRS